MVSIVRFFVISLALLLGLQATSAARPFHARRDRGDRHTHRAIQIEPDAAPDARQAGPQQAVSDHAVAEAAAKPTQVLVEVALLQVTLDKQLADSGVDLKTLGGAGNVWSTNESGVKVGTIGGSPADLMKSLVSTCETTVLAAPRLLVLDRQQADVHLGDQLGYETTDDAGRKTVKYIPLGTQLRVRPFVSAGGKIRLELCAQRSTGQLDSRGIPQIDSVQVTVNVIMSDSSTVVISGPAYTDVIHQRAIPTALSWFIPCIDCFFPEVDTATHRQLVAVLTSRTVRQ
jgi:hypothetical protein